MKTKHFTEAEYKRLKDYLASHSAVDAEALLVEVMLRTGCRIEEARTLEFRFFDFDRKEVFIKAAKGSVDRSVPVDEAFLARVKVWESKMPPSGLMIHLITTSIVSRIQKQRLARWFHRILDAAGIRAPYTPHCLRHSFALRMLKRTPDLQKVQMALGHNAITSTIRYLQYLKYDDIKDDILKAVG